MMRFAGCTAYRCGVQRRQGSGSRRCGSWRRLFNPRHTAMPAKVGRIVKAKGTPPTKLEFVFQVVVARLQVHDLKGPCRFVGEFS